MTLSPVGAKTQTDANSEFTLEFTLDAPLKAKQRKRGIATLKVERRGHITRQVRIASRDYFSQESPVNIKLQPEPVDPNLTGFTVQMDPCLLYTSPSPRDATLSRMPSSA